MHEASRRDEPNRLLNSLSDACYDRVLGMSETIDLPRDEVLSSSGRATPFAHFPQSGCLSVITTVDDRIRVEVGTVGWEGMTGLSFLHGVDAVPADTIVQVPATARRIPRADFKDELESNPELLLLMHRYAQFWAEQSERSIACNGVHMIESRCARWLLATHDRVGSDVLPLTQEFLAVMLAVRRASVSVAAESLQRAGLISYSRGKITVRDRKGLEAASCECYSAIQSSYARLLSPRSADGGSRQTS
jgi:CRP-like cAMP-binding protein